MSSFVKKSLVSFGLIVAFFAPTRGFCGIWELTHDAIARNRVQTTHEQVLSHLELLTSRENIVAGADHEGSLVIIGEHIVISSVAIRSYKNLEDRTKGVAPEFEFLFESPKLVDSDSKATLDPAVADSASAEKGMIRKDLKGIRISLDIIPTHPAFKDPIGRLSYEEFVLQLQGTLRTLLDSEGADVSVLRPTFPQLTGPLFDDINKNPPQIIISTQFNNDKQDCMVTFCGGNILKAEFASDRQRARFVEAVLTGKHVYSAGLGACITKHCQTELLVRPLSWGLASFEGNARPVPVTPTIRADAELEESSDYFNGIATRNLVQNGLFAKAVVVPFPDMKWVRSQVEAGHEAVWIEKYARAITHGVLDYTWKHSDLFE